MSKAPDKLLSGERVSDRRDAVMSFLSILFAVVSVIPAIYQLWHSDDSIAGLKKNITAFGMALCGFFLSALFAVIQILSKIQNAKTEDSARSQELASKVEGLATSLASGHQEIVSTIGIWKMLHRELRPHSPLADLIGELSQINGQNPHQAAQFESAVREAADRLQQIRVCKRVDYFPHSHEAKRQMLVREAVRRAQHTVKAVTFDIGDYLDECWGDFRANSAYLKEHGRNVMVQRLFILSNETVDGSAPERRKLVERVVAAHEECGIPCKVLRHGHLPAKLGEQVGRSFLLVDDCVVSESYFRDGSKAESGYFRFGKDERYDALDGLFDRLWILESYPLRCA